MGTYSWGDAKNALEKTTVILVFLIYKCEKCGNVAGWIARQPKVFVLWVPS